MEANGATKEGQGGEQDLSMEEILKSIRKIIAEDDNGENKVAEQQAKPEETKAADVPGSDVLELTEMVKEDGSVESVKAEAASGDVLGAIDKALAPEKPAEKIIEHEPAPVTAAPPPAAAPAPPRPATVQAPPAPDSLLSSEAATTAASAFKHLQDAADPVPAAPHSVPSPAFASGNTVENMVREILYPTMKAWLDANLPQIVERIVEREVKKLTRH